MRPEGAVPRQEGRHAAVTDAVAASPSPVMTTTPPAPASGVMEARRQTTGVRGSEVLPVIGAGAAALCLASLLFSYLTPFSGLLGFVVVAYVSFLGFYMVLVSLEEAGPAVRDRLAAVFVHSLGLLMLLALVVVIGYTLLEGVEALPHLNFFTEDMGVTGGLDPLTQGGILHAMVGTLQQITIALLITVPLGIACAVFLAEVPGPLSRFVRTIVEAMTALPSIVAGLFIFATVILILGLDKSGLAAGLALSVMALPIIIRAADVVIRLVPGNLREASLALGASQWRTVRHVVLPTARSGLMTSVILGTARAIGETSPVLLTAGFTKNLNANPFSGPQVSLPLATFEFVRSPEPAYIARGFGTAATLMVLVLVLFVLARVLGGRGPGQLGRGQQRRRARASQRDANRFASRVDSTPRSEAPFGSEEGHD